MNAETNHAAPDNYSAISDARFDMRLTEKFDDGEHSGSGWMWVGALMFAGVLIVSGYLDQESPRPEEASSLARHERVALKNPETQTMTKDTKRPDHRSDKGY